MIYLRGRVKFPTGGDEKMILLAREPFWLIWCNSKADSIVWMGEDGGLAAFMMDILDVYLAYLQITFSLKLTKLEVF